MYIRTPCAVCGENSFHNVRMRRRTLFLGDKRISWIMGADVTDSCTPEELARSALYVLADHVYNGISTNELCKILKEKFGVLEQYCCDLVQQLKIELDMYCPDRQHLYYVEAVFP
ncbi:hypothetical protein [Methanolobus halotolerans]|uniref:Uncharacterized protein n=1 Tax=Methanolobus halotolerans TaxID=2052935 RepID=A0A4E0QQB6_9EURY|nr:hypothetical protein [Methanolobus halotolerans]TGC07404.1 hypothetical protein CUN85_11405 [Methanolobus halotolerans]